VVKNFDPMLDITCGICFENLTGKTKEILNNCGHMYHRACIAEFFKLRINECKLPLACPHHECLKETPESELKRILSPEYMKKLQDFTLKMFMEQHADEIIVCPTPDCKYFIFKNDVKMEGRKAFHCEICLKAFCLNCMLELHPDIDCEKALKLNQKDENDEKFLQFAAENRYVQCPKCCWWIWRYEGCDKVVCRCSARFCYICKAPDYTCDHGGRYDNDHPDRYW